MSVRLYLDDDSGLLALISQARQEGLTVVRSDDVGMRGASDAEHLRYAAATGLVLVTCNWREASPDEFVGKAEWLKDWLAL